MEALTLIRDELNEDGQILWDALPNELKEKYAVLWQPVEFVLVSAVLGELRWHQCQRCGAGVLGKHVHRSWHAGLSLRVWVISAATNRTNENMATLSTAIEQYLQSLLDGDEE